MPRRSPRPAAEIRRLVTWAATEVFAERGYARATTLDIARRAGVTPSQLFAQFGQKARLFEVAVTDPYCAQIAEFVDRWQRTPTRDLGERRLGYEIARGLFTVLEAEFGLLTTLVVAQAHEEALEEEVAPSLRAVEDALGPFEKLVAAELDRHGQRRDDAFLVTRLTLGTALAAALFRGWFDGQQVDRDRDARALTRLALDGLAVRRRPRVRSTAPDAAAATGDTRTDSTRGRLLDAATDLFGRHGFPGVGTRTIAEAAGTAEPTLFRVFGDKTTLFDQAIRQRWSRQAADFASANRDRDPADLDGLIADMFALLHCNRQSLISLLEADLNHCDTGHRASPDGHGLRRLADCIADRLRGSDAEAARAARLAVCTVLGPAVLDVWLFTGHRPDRTRLTSELQSFLVHGVRGDGTD